MNVSFSGCGFLGIYHIGVASALQKYAPDFLLNKIGGASGGGIAACALICNICLGQATSVVLKVAIKARKNALGPLHPSFSLNNIVREGLMNSLPDDAHKIASGRLHLSLTRLSDGRNVMVSEFHSKEDLVDALVCSAFIPFYSGTKAPKFRGEKYIDGGWSDNLPILGENTITVSPFSGEADICPVDADSESFLNFNFKNTSIRFTSRNMYRIAVALFPPHPEVMSDMCQQGFEDTLRFLASHNLFHCAHCIAVRSCVFMKDEQQRNNEEGSTERGRVLPRRVSITTNPDHRPVEFDCKRCKDTAARAPRKAFNEAIAYENSILRYFFYSRPVTLLRILSLPWMLPLDLSFLMMKKLFIGVPSQMIRTTKDVMQFIFNQVDIQNRFYGPSFKCSLNVKDLSYSTFSADVASNFDALQVHGNFSLPTASTENNQYLMREMKFDFLVDGDDMPKNETTQKISNIITNDDLEDGMQLSSDSVGKAVEELEWERLQQASIFKEGMNTSDGSTVSDSENVGSLDEVLDYARKHDALMAFYYLDEQNLLKVREFFQLEESSSSKEMEGQDERIPTPFQIPVYFIFHAVEVMNMLSVHKCKNNRISTDLSIFVELNVRIAICVYFGKKCMLKKKKKHAVSKIARRMTNAWSSGTVFSEVCVSTVSAALVDCKRLT
ncbi:Uncharacterized protein T03_7348 [Trichinella britovi]|uniref:triacylglycerol lipase n=1 Tax=Trichinella britovi TaxID=45882 RepID=A0A0V1DAT9_TRIBR|nr:Uncharacterized protein T03_7348 [Trichinella britovi]